MSSYWENTFARYKGNKDFIAGLKAAINAFAIYRSDSDRIKIIGTMQTPIETIYKEIDEQLDHE